MDNLNHHITLKDGRRLGYAETGDPQGEVIFFFHGLPGSRLEIGLIGVVAAAKGARLIAIDRPGAGLSDFQPGRRFVDWPDDVLGLADALGLSSFRVLGVSGGGPYVLACARKIPGRLKAAGVIAGVGPFSEPEATKGMVKGNIQLFKIARSFPFILHLLFRFQMRGDLEKKVPAMLKRLPEPDRRALGGNRAILQLMLADTREAFRQGTKGVVHEIVMGVNPWGFDLKDISMKIYLWQGEQDTNVPPAMGRYQARTLPNCQAVFYPDEGHMSLVVNHIGEMLDKMLS